MYYIIFDLQVLKMNFGDWELFRIVLLALRDKEYLINNENNSNSNFKHTRTGSSKNNSHERRGIEIFIIITFYKITTHYIFFYDNFIL